METERKSVELLYCIHNAQQSPKKPMPRMGKKVLFASIYYKSEEVRVSFVDDLTKCSK